MLWIFFTLVAAFLWAIVNILDKFIITNKVKDPILATIFSGIATFFLFILVSLIVGNIFLSIKVIIIAALAGVSYNIAVWLYYIVLSKEEVSKYVPIIATAPIFVTIFAFCFLGERLSFLQYLGIIIIVLGAILIGVKKNSYKLTLGTSFLVAISAAIFFALRNIFIKFATPEANIWSILFWVGIGGISSIFLFLLFQPASLKRIKTKDIFLFVLIGVITAIAFFIFTKALSIGSVSLVSGLVNVELLFVFFMATFLSIFYSKIIKEKISKKIIAQKLFAIIIIIVGAILII
jgi:transporter family protein